MDMPELKLDTKKIVLYSLIWVVVCTWVAFSIGAVLFLYMKAISEFLGPWTLPVIVLGPVILVLVVALVAYIVITQRQNRRKTETTSLTIVRNRKIS